jgi:hypothetical protein
MQVKWLSLVMVFIPLVVNANQNAALPDIEFLEFLGSYSSEDQTWLELAMEEEQRQQQLNKSNGSTVSVGDSKHD